jgi:hypothetical protein
MASLWPWVAVAGMGALHGLNPATGWMLVAAGGLRSGERARAWHALLPIAVGHVASVALVAAAVARGLAVDRKLVLAVAIGLMGVVAIVHVRGHAAPRRRPAPTGQAGLALWSFAMSTAHGAGMMLVPALVPVCLQGVPGRELTASGSLGLGLAVVAVHAGAMLVVTGAIAAGVSRAAAAWAKRLALRARPGAPTWRP